jgi:hypothetical protein
MASTARIGDQGVVNSFNLFIDTDRISVTGATQNRGDDTSLHFEGNAIMAGDGELIRMTLVSFDMHNNFYTLDRYNSNLRFLHKGGRTNVYLEATSTTGLGVADLYMPFKNYGSLADIGLEFAILVAKQVAARSVIDTTNSPKVKITSMKNIYKEGATALSTVSIISTTTSADFATAMDSGTRVTLGQTSNKLIEITLDVYKADGTTAHNHGLTQLAIQCVDSKGDSHLILGAERFDSPYIINNMESTDDLGNSFTVTFPTTSSIKIRGYFPMQLQSDPYIYLRCDLTQSGGLETVGMSNAQLNAASNTSDLTSSDVFAKIRRDTAFCTYNTAADEFFINIQQRKVSSLRLYITDSKNRAIGQDTRARTGTAAGWVENENTNPDPVSFGQDTLGNLSFTCVIRVDIIKTSQVTKLETTPLPLPLPARKAQQGVIFGLPDFGMAKIGV